MYVFSFIASIKGRYSSEGAISTYSQNAKNTHLMSDFLNDVFYHQGSTNVPVVIPMTTFSPPSNPVVHHSLIGPIAFVGIPPLIEKNNVKETLCEYFFALHNSGRISLHPSFLGYCLFQVLGNEECDLLSLELCLCISS